MTNTTQNNPAAAGEPSAAALHAADVVDWANTEIAVAHREVGALFGTPDPDPVQVSTYLRFLLDRYVRWGEAVRDYDSVVRALKARDRELEAICGVLGMRPDATVAAQIEGKIEGLQRSVSDAEAAKLAATERMNELDRRLAAALHELDEARSNVAGERVESLTTFERLQFPSTSMLALHHAAVFDSDRHVRIEAVKALGVIALGSTPKPPGNTWADTGSATVPIENKQDQAELLTDLIQSHDAESAKLVHVWIDSGREDAPTAENVKRLLQDWALSQKRLAWFADLYDRLDGDRPALLSSLVGQRFGIYKDRAFVPPTTDEQRLHAAELAENRLSSDPPGLTVAADVGTGDRPHCRWAIYDTRATPLRHPPTAPCLAMGQWSVAHPTIVRMIGRARAWAMYPEGVTSDLTSAPPTP